MIHYISCRKFTCYVETDKNNIIIDTAPILKKFIGQHIEKLKNGIKNLEIIK